MLLPAKGESPLIDSYFKRKGMFMAYSRFLVPFFAIFMGVIGAYTVYLITAKNIFNVSVFQQPSTLEVSLVDSPISDSVNEIN